MFIEDAANGPAVVNALHQSGSPSCHHADEMGRGTRRDAHASLVAEPSGHAVIRLGDVGVRGVGREPRLFVSMILVMIFSEAIALFGLIVALVLSS